LHLFACIKEDLRGIPALLQAFAHRAKEEGSEAGGEPLGDGAKIAQRADCI
jgi:hypothetical protein